MDIETRVSKVEGDVDQLKVQCAVAHAEHASKDEVGLARLEMKEDFHAFRLEFKEELQGVKHALQNDMHALELRMQQSEMRMQQSMHSLEVRIEKSMHAQTWALLGGVFAMLTATVTIVFYMTS